MKNFQNLYVHFPFCETKCHYCDFFSLPEKKVDTKKQHNIYDAILRELDFYPLTKLQTVFLGGGTPSLVPIEFLEKLFLKIQLEKKSETTAEVNPSSVDLRSAQSWCKLGINRISMGVQALDDKRLGWLGRVHNKKEVFCALENIFMAGFENVSVDYIVGVPEQTTDIIQKELKELFSCFPEIMHVSAYLLTLKHSNPKYGSLLGEEEQLAQLLAVCDALRGYGFEHYEISNFAKSNKQALHNLNYWNAGSYLGIGPSAHSYWLEEKKRTKNWASLEKYQDLVLNQTPPIEWDETLTAEQECIEYLMLKLRRKSGLNILEFNEKFGKDFYRQNLALLRELESHGLAFFNEEAFSLTSKGFFASDEIFPRLV